MRIAYMLTSLGIGGAERQVVALAERMQARGHEVVLVVLQPKRAREWQTDVEIVRLNMEKSALDVARGIANGRRFLRKFRPDLVHSHTFPANMVARVLRCCGAVPRVLTTIHNIYEGGRGRTIAYWLSDRFSMHTTAVSEAVAERYCTIGAVRRDKCSVITNGIDTDGFAPGAVGSGGRRTVRANKSFVWLSAGRDVPAKDFDNMLSAFRRVREKVPECDLWIAGEISRERRQSLNAQRAMRRGSESDGVRWLGVCEDIRSVLLSSDAFVLSSAWEGLPLVLGEAMAMEKPVVATDVGGVRELAANCGLLVPVKDSVALADAMLRVMRLSQSDRAMMGRSGREQVCRHFNMNAKVEEWERLYTRLLQ